MKKLNFVISCHIYKNNLYILNAVVEMKIKTLFVDFI